MLGDKEGRPLLPHPVPLNLFDPFKLSKNATPEKKAKGLLAEINNGRLAMLGIMAFVSESRVPGSVPALKGLNIAPYDGEVMAPFSAGDASLPFVKDMPIEEAAARATLAKNVFARILMDSSTLAKL